MLLIFGIALLLSAVTGQMHPPPPPYNNAPPYNAPPPPYNMFGMPYMPQPMMPMAPPPMQPPPMPPSYPASTSVSYTTYPLIPAAAAPYPAYGIPPPPPSQPIMYPPPYQTFSGSGPMGDPFTSSTGVCKYTNSRYMSPVAPYFNGYYKRANMGMVCTRYS